MGKVKLQSPPEIELDEAVSIWGKPYVFEKPSNILQTKPKAVQSHNENTLQDFRNRLKKNKANCAIS